jgi:2-oxoglutarate dehydrogenase E2 component (dihydrolipoamide succinyltransferase)
VRDLIVANIADVLAPPNEEGTRATILRWCKLVGDEVLKDEPLVELETDKVTVEVAAPVSGTLIEVLKQVNAEVTPDEVLARLRLQGETSPGNALAAVPAAASAAANSLA